MFLYGREDAGRKFLLRVIRARLSGMTKEEFAERELRFMRCEWCRDGYPVDGEGNHNVFGVIFPCEAEEAEDDDGSDS